MKWYVEGSEYKECISNIEDVSVIYIYMNFLNFLKLFILQNNIYKVSYIDRSYDYIPWGFTAIAIIMILFPASVIILRKMRLKKFRHEVNQPLVSK